MLRAGDGWCEDGIAGCCCRRGIEDGLGREESTVDGVEGKERMDVCEGPVVEAVNTGRSHYASFEGVGRQLPETLVRRSRQYRDAISTPIASVRVGIDDCCWLLLVRA
jgi:hypothetical protein